MTLDTVAPVISAASISSNDSNTAEAKAGSVVTVAFTTDGTEASRSATIDGHAATITHVSGNSYTASATLTGSEGDGAVAFSITATDAAGNVGTRAAVTDASTVTLDTVAPVLSAQSSISVTESSPGSGAAVTWTVTATDTHDGADAVSYHEGATVRHSGDTFAAGSHTITATAVDGAGNAVSETFSITVNAAVPPPAPVPAPSPDPAPSPSPSPSPSPAPTPTPTPSPAPSYVAPPVAAVPAPISTPASIAAPSAATVAAPVQAEAPVEAAPISAPSSDAATPIQVSGGAGTSVSIAIPPSSAPPQSVTIDGRPAAISVNKDGGFTATAVLPADHQGGVTVQVTTADGKTVTTHAAPAAGDHASTVVKPPPAKVAPASPQKHASLDFMGQIAAAAANRNTALFDLAALDRAFGALVS